MKKRNLALTILLFCMILLSACGGRTGRDSGEDRDRHSERRESSSREDDNDDRTHEADDQEENPIADNSNGGASSNDDLDNPFSDLADVYDAEYETGESGKRLFQYDESLYSRILAAPDDPYDFCAATDFKSLGDSESSWGLNLNIADSGGYSAVFDFDKPTLNDLDDVIDSNNNIDIKYKSFIKDYVRQWLELWPDSDFSVLYYNLRDLEIQECTPEEIYRIALSDKTVACYRNGENKIYVREGLDLNDRSSDDYIVLSHELTHPARTLTISEGKNDYIFWSYVLDISYEGGCMYDEAVITNLIYEMQGDGRRSTYYTVPCSYYRIIMDCTGYDGTDYMNHSSNYLAKRMGEFMGDECYAYYIMELIGYRFKEKTSGYMSYEIEDYSPLYEYITRMYMMKYLTEEMTAAEAEAVFDDFTEEMAWNIENLTVEYEEQDPATFRPFFEAYCEELGISL